MNTITIQEIENGKEKNQNKMIENALEDLTLALKN